MSKAQGIFDFSVHHPFKIDIYIHYGVALHYDVLVFYTPQP